MNLAAKAYISGKYLEYSRAIRPNPAKAQAIEALMKELNVEPMERLKTAQVSDGSLCSAPSLNELDIRYILSNFHAYASIPSANGRDMAIALRELIDYFKIDLKTSAMRK